MRLSPARVARDIITQLGMINPAGYKGSFFRPNLHIYTRKKGDGDTRRRAPGKAPRTGTRSGQESSAPMGALGAALLNSCDSYFAGAGLATVAAPLVSSAVLPAVAGLGPRLGSLLAATAIYFVPSVLLAMVTNDIGLMLLSAARAWALLGGRSMALPEDIQAVFPAVAARNR